MAKRKRSIQLSFRVSPEEHEAIQQKMAELDEWDRKSYFRRMAIDGYIINIELSEIPELLALHRRDSNNLNQIAKRVNAAGYINNEDFEEIIRNQKVLDEKLKDILNALADLSVEL